MVTVNGRNARVIRILDLPVSALRDACENAIPRAMGESKPLMEQEGPILDWREATPNDPPFLTNLLEQTILEYLDKDETASEQVWKEGFDLVITFWKWQVISVEGVDVGAVAIDTSAGVAHVQAICVLPEYQNRGIGSQILRELIYWAHNRSRPVLLEVFKKNTRAQRLYERLGFVRVAETETHFHMAFYPPERPAFWKKWIQRLQGLLPK